MDTQTAFRGFGKSSQRVEHELVREQQFTVAHMSVTFVTFVERMLQVSVPEIYLTGLLVERDVSTGYFNQRGYMGNSLKDGEIYPLLSNGSGVYDLSFNEQVVASFSFSPHLKQWFIKQGQ